MPLHSLSFGNWADKYGRNYNHIRWACQSTPLLSHDFEAFCTYAHAAHRIKRKHDALEARHGREQAPEAAKRTLMSPITLQKDRRNHGLVQAFQEIGGPAREVQEQGSQQRGSHKKKSSAGVVGIRRHAIDTWTQTFRLSGMQTPCKQEAQNPLLRSRATYRDLKPARRPGLSIVWLRSRFRIYRPRRSPTTFAIRCAESGRATRRAFSTNRAHSSGRVIQRVSVRTRS